MREKSVSGFGRLEGVDYPRIPPKRPNDKPPTPGYDIVLWLWNVLIKLLIFHNGDWNVG